MSIFRLCATTFVALKAFTSGAEPTQNKRTGCNSFKNREEPKSLKIRKQKINFFNTMSQLSKSELAAIDLMIAQLEEKGVQQFGSFISSIVNAVTDVASAATNIATDVASAASSVATAACPAVQVAAQVCPMAAAAGSKAQTLAEQKVIEGSNLNSVLTIAELKAIRQKYS